MATYYVVDPQGTLAVFPSPAAADLTALNASNLTTGTIPDARFPATLPAASGANLTALNASNLTTGTIPLARVSGLTNTQIDAAAAIAWSKLSKSGSSLADLATRSAADLSSGILATARFRTVTTNTDVGSQNNWAPGLSGDTMCFWSGASDGTITGVAGGVTGQVFAVKNTGTKVLYFSHQSASSSAGNKLTNLVTSGTTPVAAGGYIFFVYDGTTWQLVAHEQGAAVSVTYSSGNFTADGSMTWTVESGDVVFNNFKLIGTIVEWWLRLQTTTVGGTPDFGLRVTIPNGFTGVDQLFGDMCFAGDNTSAFVPGSLRPITNATYLQIIKDLGSGGNWTASTNNTYVTFHIRFRVN